MSFDLAVWHEPAAITHEQAARWYELLCDERHAGVEAHARVIRFFEDLVDRFPPLETLPEDQLERGAWSVSPTLVGGGVVMCVMWRRADEVRHAVDELVERHGLVRFDPRTARVLLPTALAPRESTLTGDGLAAVADPTGEEVSRAVSLLGQRYAYLILERGPGHFVQAAHGATAGGLADGWYAVEYRDGSADAHFRRETRDLATVIGVFDDFVRGDDSWRAHEDWRPWP
jgi:hypothetical protein